MTAQARVDSPPWHSLLWLAAVAVVLLGLLLVFLSLWFAPPVGLLMVALGASGGKAGFPRPLAFTVLGLGCLLLILSVLAFIPPLGEPERVGIDAGVIAPTSPWRG